MYARYYLRTVSPNPEEGRVLDMPTLPASGLGDVRTVLEKSADYLAALNHLEGGFESVAVVFDMGREDDDDAVTTRAGLVWLAPSPGPTPEHGYYQRSYCLIDVVGGRSWHYNPSPQAVLDLTEVVYGEVLGNLRGRTEG
jgi:hypothetical protein